MMDEEELEIELIEAFIAKKLSAEETAQVTERMRLDVAFAQKVDDYTAIINGIHLYGHTVLQQDLHSWEVEINNQAAGKREIHWNTYLSIAAAVLLAVVAGLYFLFYKPIPLTGTQIFASNFKPYEDVVTVRGDASPQNDLAQAMGFYNEGKYQNAIPYFETALQKSPTADVPQFYLASSLLALNRSEEALPLLLNLEHTQSIFHEQIQWYLALAYELQNNKIEATDRLRAIANDAAHSYNERAAKLLQE